MSSEYIPFEIQTEVLKRLPVQPLLRFRSVSKSYKRLIDSPYFMVSYGVRYPLPDNFILRCDVYYRGEIFLSFVDNDDGFVQQKSISFVRELIADPLAFNILESSHGLMCFYSYHQSYSDDIKEMITLWNPSIRKSVVIQVPPYKVKWFKNPGFYNYFCFGVCPVTCDPTILVIKYINFDQKMKYMPGISVPWRVRVFTLSTGTWSVLSSGLPRESIRFRGSEVVIDRFIYCVAYDYMLVDAEDGRSQSPFLIMSFDLTAKEFKQINLTGGLNNRLCSIESISKLRESLVLLEYRREFEGDVSVCSLWMMKKQCDNISFTKLYNINMPHATVKALLGFRKTGELILETTQEDKDNAELQVYDPSSEAIDNLGIEGDYDSFFMCSYMETLLLHDHLDGFIYWNSKQSQNEDME